MASKRKNPANDQNANADICDFLMELAEYEKNVSRNVFKYNAYRNAANTLARHPTPLRDGREARRIKGVGEKIADKIDEFVRTGKVSKLEKIHASDTAQAISLVARVWGIGPAKARDLVGLGVRTIQDLHDHKDKLTHKQIIGLKYFKDFEMQIPRKEMVQIEERILKFIAEVDEDYIATICGSYRRGKDTSGDVDVLLAHPSLTSGSKLNKRDVLDRVVAKLKREGLITDALAEGEVKFMGVCQLQTDLPHRRLDIRLLPHDQYFCGLLYFTGSDLFNKNMRLHALQNGFTLNEYAVRPVGSTGVAGEVLPVSSERDIFEYIDYPYKEPHQRST